MIFEDIQSKEDSESKTISDSIERWMIGTAMKAKSPKGCFFIFVGNMYPTPNSILKKLKINPTWTKFISGAILADGTALWPELRSISSLMQEFENDLAMGHPEIFFSEVLNDTEVGANTNVDFTKFQEWIWGPQDLPQGKFLVIDPSQGKGMDLDCIGYFEVYDEVIGVRSLITAHFSPLNLIRQALALALINNVRFIAIEAMAYQATLLFWFEHVSKEIGITGIICVPIYAQSASKNSRIAAGIKALEAGQIILHPTIRSRVHKQISDWKPMKRDNVDDALDVVSYAPKVMAEYPVQIETTFSLDSIEGMGAEVVENNHCF
jgi:hypothetical protein